MNEKKHDHDILEAKHIHELWRNDLDGFITEMEKCWEQEEVERLKHGSVKNEGKRKRKAPAKKGKAINNKREPENEPLIANKVRKASKKRSMAAAAAESIKPKNPDEMTLRERMAGRFGKDMPMQSSLLSGRDGLTAAQMDSKKRGLGGGKRKAEETTIF